MPHGETREYEVVRLRERHEEICRLIAAGMENSDIARHLGVTPQNVSDVRNSKVAQEKIEIFRAARDADTVSVARTIQQVAPQALKILTETVRRTNERLMNDKNEMPNVKEINVAKDLLDRAGHNVVNKNINVNEDLDSMEKRIEAMKDRARRAANIVDASYSEVQNAD